MELAVDAAFNEMRTHIDRPFAILGHSLGARIGAEVAQRFERAAEPPAAFIALACSGGAWSAGSVDGLSDDELTRRILARRWTAPEIMAHAELRQMTLDVLRADLAIAATSRLEQLVLRTPILALGGHEDGSVSRQAIALWHDRGESVVETAMHGGGHFFPHQHVDTTVRAVTQFLQRCLRDRTG